MTKLIRIKAEEGKVFQSILTGAILTDELILGCQDSEKNYRQVVELEARKEQEEKLEAERKALEEKMRLEEEAKLKAEEASQEEEEITEVIEEIQPTEEE